MDELLLYPVGKNLVREYDSLWGAEEMFSSFQGLASASEPRCALQLWISALQHTVVPAYAFWEGGGFFGL